MTESLVMQREHNRFRKGLRHVRTAEEYRCPHQARGYKQAGNPAVFLGRDVRTGRRETFGINVFKVREVMRTPPITSAPEMPAAVEGMVSLRGALVPVIDLAKYAGVQTETPRDIMIVTEYNGHTQGFLSKGGYHPATGLEPDARSAGDVDGGNGRPRDGGYRTRGQSPRNDDGRRESVG